MVLARIFSLRMQHLGPSSVQGTERFRNGFQVFIFNWNLPPPLPLSLPPSFIPSFPPFLSLLLAEIPEVRGEQRAKNCLYSCHSNSGGIKTKQNLTALCRIGYMKIY